METAEYNGTKELEKAVCSQFDNGRYMSLGSDGGVLQYIAINIYGQLVRASITLDHDIAAIRRIWELTVDDKPVYDMTKDYYELRKA